MYETRNNGSMKLVALEYLVFRPTGPGPSPPELFGRTFDFIPSPNRFGLPPFYALHAWIWKPNPSGILQPGTRASAARRRTGHGRGLTPAMSLFVRRRAPRPAAPARSGRGG